MGNAAPRQIDRELGRTGQGGRGEPVHVANHGEGRLKRPETQIRCSGSREWHRRKRKATIEKDRPERCAAHGLVRDGRRHVLVNAYHAAEIDDRT